MVVKKESGKREWRNDLQEAKQRKRTDTDIHPHPQKGVYTVKVPGKVVLSLKSEGKEAKNRL